MNKRHPVPAAAPSVPLLDPPEHACADKASRALARVAGRMQSWRPAREVLRRVRAVPTIFPAFDMATRVGGFPIDRFSVVHGETAHGKSEFALGLGLSFLRRGHIFAFVDAEFTTPIDWLESLMSGYVENPAFLALRPKSYEQTVDAVRECARVISAAKKTGELPESTSALVVVDSIRKLVPEDFIEKIRKLGAQGDRGSVDGMSGMGGAIKAKMNADWFDELAPLLYETGTALLAIARERENKDAPRNAPQYKVGGGRAVEYEASMSVRIERDYVREGKGAEAVVVGERHDCVIHKSKVAGRDDKVSTGYFYTSNGKVTPAGFDPARDLLELGIELGVVKTAGAWFSFGGKRWNGKSQAVKRIHADVELRAELEKAARSRFESIGEKVQV